MASETAAAHVAVVGGGITGLATAWFLRQRAPDLRLTVLEADQRMGGKIRTDQLSAVAGVPVEAGPDTFLARVPWAVDLCHALDLGDDLVAPATGRAYVWTRGDLRPLPEGLVLGVPARLAPLARSRIVSTRGLVRAGLDLVLPQRDDLGEDPSVAAVVGARFGPEVVERVVEPLLGGIHAGRADRLSFRSVAPDLAEAAAGHRSLLLALRARSGPYLKPAAPAGPVFLGLTGGLQRLVDRLVERLENTAQLQTRSRPSAIEPTPDGRWALSGSTGLRTEADAVVLTAPAFAAAPLLRAVCPSAAARLDGIAYASVATVTLAYRPEAVRRALDGSGFLVPRVDGRLLTACTWSTSKWPALAESGCVLLRASTGRWGDERPFQLDESELTRRLHQELALAVGLDQEPVASHVARWPRSLPQYEVGHQARVAAAETDLARAAPGVVLAGAAYHGLGIAACIRQADEAAAKVVDQLTRLRTSRS